MFQLTNQLYFDVSDEWTCSRALECKLATLYEKLTEQKSKNGKTYKVQCHNNPGKPLTFVVERDGQLIELNITPNTLESNGIEYGQIGVAYQSPLEYNPLKAVVFGAEQTWRYTTLIFDLLGQLVTGQLSIDALSGPVGIYKATEDSCTRWYLEFNELGCIIKY